MAGSGSSDIKTKIVLEGEKEYNQELKDAQRELRRLRSELSAETAELGSNADEQEKNRVKTYNLRKQIEEQEKVVNTLKAALEEAKTKYADNDEVITKWEIKLNNARTTLANMQNDLETTGSSIDSVNTSTENGVSATHDFAESIEKIGDVGKSISEKIEGFFSGMVDTIRGTVEALWGELIEISAKANNWTDLSAMFGTDAATMQKWERATRANVKDFSQLTGMANKMLTGDKAKIAEATGIDLTGYTDQWEGFLKIMENLSTMGQPEQLAALEAMGIHGAKEAGWLDMLNAWGGIIDKLDDFDAENGGLGISAGNIDILNELSLQAASLSESWAAFKESWLAGLAPLALNISGNLEEIIQGLNAYLKADNDADRQAALDSIEQNVLEIFGAIREAFEKGIGLLGELATRLKDSDDPMAKALGNMIDRLVGALEWFADEKNWKAVESGFKALIGVWAAGKVTSAVSNIASFALNASNLAKFGGGNAAASAASSGTTAAATGGGLFGKFGAWLGSSGVGGALTAMGLDASVIMAAIAPALIAQKENEKEWIEEQNERDEAAARAEARGDAGNAAILRGASGGTGPRRDANGNYLHDWTGMFLDMGPTGLTESTLMGLKDRKNQQMAELYNLVSTYAPEGTWSQLTRYWENQDLDPFEVTQLMDNMAEAAKAFGEAQEQKESEWAEKLLEQQDLSRQTDEELNKTIKETDTEGATERGIIKGMRGVTVVMDRETVGRLVAPIVSEQIARDLNV